MKKLLFFVSAILLMFSNAFCGIVDDYNNWVLPTYYEKPAALQIDYMPGTTAGSAASMLSAKGYGNVTDIYNVLVSNSSSYGSTNYDAINWYLNSYTTNASHAVTNLAFSNTGGIIITGGGGAINQLDFDIDIWTKSIAFMLGDCSQISIDILGIDGQIVDSFLVWGWVTTEYWQDAGYHFDTDPGDAAACRLIDGFIKTNNGITDINTLELVDNGHGGLCLEHQTAGDWVDINFYDYSVTSSWFCLAGVDITQFSITCITAIDYEEWYCVPEPCSILSIIAGSVILAKRRR